MPRGTSLLVFPPRFSSAQRGGRPVVLLGAVVVPVLVPVGLVPVEPVPDGEPPVAPLVEPLTVLVRFVPLVPALPVPVLPLIPPTTPFTPLPFAPVPPVLSDPLRVPPAIAPGAEAPIET